MAEAFKNLQLYFSYPFVRYALIVGVLIAVCSSLLGVTLVLKRFSFIGDGLSHVAFGAMAIAAVLKFTSQTVVILPITVICAILLLKGGNSSKIRGDAAIAMLSVGALALGYLLMNIFSPSANVSGDVCSTLFGSTSILTLSRGEVILCAVLSLVVITLFILLYNKLFAVTFDESFSPRYGGEYFGVQYAYSRYNRGGNSAGYESCGLAAYIGAYSFPRAFCNAALQKLFCRFGFFGGFRRGMHRPRYDNLRTCGNACGGYGSGGGYSGLYFILCAWQSA